MIVDRQKKTHHFYFFFKNHCRLPVNQTVRALQEGEPWNGDIVILCRAARSNRVVNMRGKDAHLADFALWMYVFF